MAGLRAADKTSLKSLFGTRVSFNRMERKLCGHDIAEIPGLIKPFVGSTVRRYGLQVPNRMDGLPAVTQEPVQPGESFR